MSKKNDPPFDWENASVEEMIQELTRRGLWYPLEQNQPKATADTSAASSLRQRRHKQPRRIMDASPLPCVVG